MCGARGKNYLWHFTAAVTGCRKALLHHRYGGIGCCGVHFSLSTLPVCIPAKAFLHRSTPHQGCSDVVRQNKID